MSQLVKYNTSSNIYFTMIKAGVVDLAQTADWTPATGDTKISKDGATLANTTNNPAIVSGTNGVVWKLALTSTETTAAQIMVQIVDSATKAVEDNVLAVDTYGNTSAKYVTDFSVVAMGAVMPTTPGNTLDVASTGEAGLDFSNLKVPVGAIPILGIEDNGTAQTVNAISIQLRSGAPAYANGSLVGATVVLPTLGITGLVNNFIGTTNTAFVTGWSDNSTPTGTPTYVVFGTAPGTANISVNIASINNVPIIGNGTTVPFTV